jgi:tetratricopeptide (TPR) repeat protein
MSLQKVSAGNEMTTQSFNINIVKFLRFARNDKIDTFASVLLFFIISLSLLIFSQLNAQTNPVENLKKNSMEAQQRLLTEQNLRKDQQQFRNAQNYINLNQYHIAIPMLEDLLKRNPDNFTYYDWLLRCYLITADLSQADSLVSIFRQINPRNPIYEVDQASIMYRREEKDKALEKWNQILQSNPSDINLYQRVASALVENRLLDEAIKIYQQAIARIPNSESFFLNIAELYRSRLMYVEAAQYYLKYLQKVPGQQSFVFNQILAFQIEPEQRPKFFQTLEKIMLQDPQPGLITLLTAQLYQRYGEFEKAFLLYQEMDDPKSEGSQILQFAQAAERDSSYEVALQAYRYVIRKYPGSNQLISAYSGAISTLLQVATENSHQPSAQLALSMIDTVNQRFPQHPETNWLNYLKGVFYLDYYFDVDQSIDIFTTISSNKKVVQKLRDEAMLKLGECYLIRGQIDKALQIYGKIVQPPYNGEALLGTARTYYFLKQWDQCQQTIQTILQTQGVSSPVTNDALALQILLGYSQDAPEILGKYSEGELLIVQRKKSEAFKKLKDIIEMKNVPAALKADVYLRLSRLSLELQEPLTALEYCNQAIKDPLIQPYADEHLYLLAGILEKSVNRPQEAFSAYKQLLEIYPNSLLADAARERMKYLREKPNFEIP